MPFETGVVVFFRLLGQDNNLARSVHPDGRSVALDLPQWPAEDYIILDAAGEFLGAYPRDWVACILPLQTTGPADVANQSPGRDRSPAPAEGDSKSVVGRAKRFDPRQ